MDFTSHAHLLATEKARTQTARHPLAGAVTRARIKASKDEVRPPHASRLKPWRVSTTSIFLALSLLERESRRRLRACDLPTTISLLCDRELLRRASIGARTSPAARLAVSFGAASVCAVMHRVLLVRRSLARPLCALCMLNASGPRTGVRIRRALAARTKCEHRPLDQFLGDNPSGAGSRIFFDLMVKLDLNSWFSSIVGEVTEGMNSRAWKLVAPHCDIEDRIRHVPPSATLRGLWHRSVLTVLKRAGKLDEYNDYFPNERWSMLTFYPLSAYMVRLAVAGALIASPSEIHQGMFEALRLNSTIFVSSILGRTLLRILAKDPVRLTEQGMAARRQTTNYGEWAIVSRGPHHIETIYRSEYVWIDSAIAGSAVGTFEACDLKASLQTQLDDRFNGSTLITW